MNFYKYQGTGNDFILIDGRSTDFNHNVALLCDRKFGIGADGLMVLKNHKDFDFEMVYYNSDGKISSMCGNGGRCIVAFAQFLGIIATKTTFLAVDGMHEAKILENQVSLGMNDVSAIKVYQNIDLIIDTGSPHYLKQITDLASLNLLREARQIRYNNDFSTNGINVNFIALHQGKAHIRTYERGVEDETLSCGTGVTAAALAIHHWQKEGEGIFEKKIITQGGELVVIFSYTNHIGYTDILLQGPALQVFKGEI